MAAPSRYDAGKPLSSMASLGKPYPNQIFAALIWGSDRPKFGRPRVVGQADLHDRGNQALSRAILRDPRQLVQK
jgi:hypothetical protein